MVSTQELTVDDALLAIAHELHELVANLGRRERGGRPWRELAAERSQRLRERCQQLRERMEEQRRAAGEALVQLRERIEGPRRSGHEALKRLGTSLQRFDTALAESTPRGRMREMRAAMARAYEEFVHRTQVSASSRMVRLPRIWRSALHMLAGLTCAFLYQVALTRSGALMALGVALGIFTSLEVSRRFSSRWNDFLVDRVFGLISRPRERYRTNSASYYLLALTVITLFTPKPAVCMAVLVLGIGDPVASFVGHRWGRHRLSSGKSLQGSVAFLIAAFAACTLYLNGFVPGITPVTLLVVGGVVAATGALTELFTGKIDDNFTIPVACALVASPFF